MSQIAVDGRWPLVGRRSELSAFSRAIEDPACNAFVLFGPPGVGKTRLAEECADMAKRAGRAGGRAIASAETAAVPLAALAHLLPADFVSHKMRPGERVDQVPMLARARSAFEVGGGARFVLMVDDLNLLDLVSVLLLRQLLANGVVFLLGTVLTEWHAPSPATSLCRDDLCQRVDLGLLSRDSVETLLYHALGAPVDGATAHALWSTSGGNVQILRELVLGAHRSGALVDEGGVWRVTGPLTGTPRLNELVAVRVARAGEDGRRVLETLALCAPIGPDGDEGTISAGAVERLEEAGLVKVTIHGRRRQVDLTHPVHRVVLRDRLSELRRRAILLDRVGVTESLGARRREDVLRIATWQLEATGEADPALLVQAAHLARFAHDYPLVVKLAGAALAQRSDPAAALLLGEALYQLGSFHEAEVALSSAEQLAERDDVRVNVAAARSANLLWGLRWSDDAIAVNRAAREAAVDQSARDELIAQEAWIQVYSGSPARAREAIELLPEAMTPRAEVVRALAESSMMSLSGLPSAGLEIARRGYEDHLLLGDQLWIDQPAGHVLAQVLALSNAGHLDAAAEIAIGGYREASAKQAPFLQIRFAFHCGRVRLLSGKVRTAGRWFREVVARGEATGFEGPRAFALSGLAVSSGLLGDVASAAQAVTAMDTVRDFGFLKPERELGRAWSLVAAGDPSAACSILLTAARDAVSSGHLTAASWLLHDVARLGQAELVAEQLGELAGKSDSELVAARAAHALALATSDFEALAQCADRLEIMGAFLLAAEAMAAASQAAGRAGLGRRSSSFAARAAALAERCEGARTPGLIGTGAVVALTPREREVAAMAAAGVGSREIASRLFLSVRTVNNHLQRVYGKLGIARRQELVASLALSDVTASDT
ncbi:MAG: LuxR C-terminal-related transcriptional regulator [Acidimicrobiales bacterium]